MYFSDQGTFKVGMSVIRIKDNHEPNQYVGVRIAEAVFIMSPSESSFTAL